MRVVAPCHEFVDPAEPLPLLAASAELGDVLVWALTDDTALVTHLRSEGGRLVSSVHWVRRSELSFEKLA